MRRHEPQARGRAPVPEAARPAAPRGRVSAGAPRPPTRRIPRPPPAPLLPAALPRRPARSPARPLAHRHLRRPVAGYDRHVGVRVGKLPVFHVASFQRHLPAARSVRRALPADGRDARWPCSGAPVRPGLPERHHNEATHPGDPPPPLPAPTSSGGAPGFRSDLRPLTRMLRASLPAARLRLRLRLPAALGSPRSPRSHAWLCGCHSPTSVPRPPLLPCFS